MRRPHVYERSAPRSSRGAYQEARLDPAVAAHDIALGLVSLVSRAEISGLSALTALLQRALDAAERASRASPVRGRPEPAPPDAASPIGPDEGRSPDGLDAFPRLPPRTS